VRLPFALLGAGLLLLANANVARAADTLTIIEGASAPGLQDALELVADGAGFYRDERLDVHKEYASNASLAAQLVASGKADVASLAVEPVLTGWERGVRLQFFFARAARLSYVLAVPDASPIRTPADFKGADIGETNTGSSGEVSAGSILAGAGLHKGDYAYVPIGYGAQALDAIANKRVAGVAFPHAELITMEAVENARFRYFRSPLLKDVANVGYAALPATIDAKSDVLARFSRAIAEAAFFIRKNPAAAARLFLAGTGTKPTPDALRIKTRELTLFEDDLPAADPASARIGYLSPLGLELYSRAIVDAGLARQVVPAGALVTGRFIRFANAFDRRAVAARAGRTP
jgi:NitT/TauT family transport system substrate-binding protein